jgi:hypothetical protein
MNWVKGLKYRVFEDVRTNDSPAVKNGVEGKKKGEGIEKTGWL